DGPVEVIARSPFVELGLSSPFSFLRGASDSIELVLTGLEMGMDSIGIADRNTLAGVVRMHSAAKGAGLRPLIGCRLDLTPLPLAGGVGGGPVVADRPSPSALRASSPPASGRGR
ncbi:MAG: PHP domain-containing protein, partial [Sphingomicrobium sp.]